MEVERIWNGTVVQERMSAWHVENKKAPQKGVVISQTEYPGTVIVRWEGGNGGEWAESVTGLVVLDEQPVQDGTRAYS